MANSVTSSGLSEAYQGAVSSRLMTNAINLTVTFNGQLAPYPHTIDLRHNAIESMDDFMQLINKRKLQNQPMPNKVMLTPEQTAILEKDVQANSKIFGGPVRTIMGFEVEVREQD